MSSGTTAEAAGAGGRQRPVRLRRTGHADRRLGALLPWSRTRSLERSGPAPAPSAKGAAAIHARGPPCAGGGSRPADEPGTESLRAGRARMRGSPAGPTPLLGDGWPGRAPWRRPGAAFLASHRGVPFKQCAKMTEGGGPATRLDRRFSRQRCRETRRSGSDSAGCVPRGWHTRCFRLLHRAPRPRHAPHHPPSLRACSERPVPPPRPDLSEGPTSAGSWAVAALGSRPVASPSGSASCS